MLSTAVSPVYPFSSQSSLLMWKRRKEVHSRVPKTIRISNSPQKSLLPPFLFSACLVATWLIKWWSQDSKQKSSQGTCSGLSQRGDRGRAKRSNRKRTVWPPEGQHRLGEPRDKGPDATERPKDTATDHSVCGWLITSDSIFIYSYLLEKVKTQDNFIHF